jgi:hypothetical protein
LATLAAWLYAGVAAGDCIDYEDYLHWVGSVDTPGDAYDVAVSGSYAYIADNSSGLRIVDISNPANPQIVGFVITPGDAWGVAVSGIYAYVADEYAGLQVVDISNPASPQIVGSVNTPGDAYSVAVSGSCAYIADRFGLQVVDISNLNRTGFIGDLVM